MTKYWPKCWSLLLGLLLYLLGMASLMAHTDKVEVHLRPSQCHEPCSTAIGIEIPAEVPLQSQLCLRISGPVAESTSCFPLTSHGVTIFVKGFPQGQYEIIVSVADLKGSRKLTVGG